MRETSVMKSGSNWICGLLFCGLLLSCGSLKAGPVNIGWTPFGTVTTAGYVSPDGKLLLFDGGAPTWTVRPVEFPHLLVPGAPIVLLPQAAGDTWPAVITVSGAGKLVHVVNGGPIQTLLPAHNFPVGASLELVQNGAQRLVLGVTGAGDLWSVDPATNTGHQINSAAESFPFGSVVSAVAAGGQYHVFAVDHFGTMHYYFGSGAIWNSVAIAGGLMPGTPVAADVFSLTVPPVQRLNVAAVDPAGNLVVWSKPSGLPWLPPEVVATGQTPGAPLEIGHTAFGPMVSTISAGGNWNIWIHDPMVGWNHYLVGPGFMMGAPIACAPAIGTFFTIDPVGRLVCANWSGSAWSTGYAMPLLAYTPQLVSRRFVPNPELPPASVTLKNTGSDPLVVQIVDLFDPRQPPEEKVPAGAGTNIELARESGGVLEEVFLVPGPGGVLLEQTASHPIPPEQRFTLAVWSDKETYQVLPFKNAKKGAPKSVTEGFSRRSQVSLGVIPIPPGDLLKDGEQMDLVEITKRLKNPGAVVHFPKPAGQP
ncbi:MAG: hypothetical protein U0936_20730 [Planctomycetaceae bacterium]